MTCPHDMWEQADWIHRQAEDGRSLVRLTCMLCGATALAAVDTPAPDAWEGGELSELPEHIR